MKIQDSLYAQGFTKIENDGSYPPEGILYRVPTEMAIGDYWIYEEENLFNIKIHNFYYQEDTVFHLRSGEWPECLNISYYDSVSGEEFGPYRQLTSGCVNTFFGGNSEFKCVFHKNIPLRSIGIEIFPAYYENYLKEQYSNEYINPTDAFISIGRTYHFPELVTILKQIWDYRGTGMAAKLFYRSKIDEIIVLILEHSNKALSDTSRSSRNISDEELKLMTDVSDYINGHFNTKISLEHLSNIAYMGTTKLKSTFKAVYGVTITEYIKIRRLSHAENLLSTTNLPVDQISIAVGYHNAGRFAASFKEYSGLFPSEYRDYAKSKHL